MICNVGGADRVVRLIVGVVLVAGALATGAVLLVTGTARRCPVNDAAGVDTSR